MSVLNIWILQAKEKPLMFTSKAKHEIKTMDEVPVYTKTYRYPFVHRKEIQDQVNEMLTNGIDPQIALSG